MDRRLFCGLPLGIFAPINKGEEDLFVGIIYFGAGYGKSINYLKARKLDEILLDIRNLRHKNLEAVKRRDWRAVVVKKKDFTKEFLRKDIFSYFGVEYEDRLLERFLRNV